MVTHGLTISNWLAARRTTCRAPCSPVAAMLIVAILGSLVACAPSSDSSTEVLPGSGDDTGNTVLYRDSWGVAHIYAPTTAAGMYAMGYAQAEDRPEQLLVNLAIALGEYAAVVGEAAMPSDLRSHMFDHYGAGQSRLSGLAPELRADVEAFAAGMNAFYDAHPDDVPEWWGDRDVDAAMILAFGRLFLYNWSIDEAYSDLERGGVDPGYEAPQRGSNQFAVSPSRSAEGAAILAIDPHLAWEGPSRFWEFRIHAGELVGSGVTLAGSPYIGLGHNRHVAWAMTTGGPDTADVFALEIDQSEPPRYRYGDEWRELTSREVTLQVRGGDPQSHTLWFSHHGPIVALRGGKAYAARIAYDDLVTLEAWRLFGLADSVEGIQEALATLTLFPQNVMAADTSGNIYYQRTGRVPVRDSAFDWSKPVDGSDPASEWQGVHPASEHLQILNPPHGYMQNCNIPPDAMMVDSPFALEDYPDYIFSGPDYGPARDGWTNQRGARAVELLAADDSVTVEEAIAYINDVHPFGSERWVEALRAAHEAFGEAHAEDLHYAQAVADLLAWDQQLTASSTGALKYERWRQELADSEHGAELAGLIDDHYAIVEGRQPKAVTLDADQQRLLVLAFTEAMDGLVERYGSLDATYGDRYRVGRGDESWPVGGGGGRIGTTTLRNMGYSSERDDGTRWGRSGQTSTQVVVLSDPPQSWMVLPLGQSDRPESPHYDDQAEKLFSQRKLKPTWWLPEDLAPNVLSRIVLDGAQR